MVKKYKKRPVVIEAVEYTGENVDEIIGFAKGYGPGVTYYMAQDELIIHTLEGDHLCSKGDFVIKGVRGEMYPCKGDIFLETYEEA